MDIRHKYCASYIRPKKMCMINTRHEYWASWITDIILSVMDTRYCLSWILTQLLCIVDSDAKQKKHVFLNKKLFKKKSCKKMFFLMVFYYYLQFKGRKVFFNTLEGLFMLYTSCKTLHSLCQLHFHWFREKLQWIRIQISIAT